jgi:hypothetical protein
MKSNRAKRLRTLEEEYSSELDAQRTIVLRVLTAEETKRGVRPGLVEMSPEEIANRPWEADPLFWGRRSPGVLPQSPSVPGPESGPIGGANVDTASTCGQGDEEPEVDRLAELEAALDAAHDLEAAACEDPKVPEVIPPVYTIVWD